MGSWGVFFSFFLSFLFIDKETGACVLLFTLYLLLFCFMQYYSNRWGEILESAFMWNISEPAGNYFCGGGGREKTIPY